jgi:MFS family permease
LIFIEVFLANGGSFLYGISLAWSAPSQPQILSSENKFAVTQNEFAWAVSMLSLGGALSCVLSGIIRSRFGTRFTIVIFALPNLLGWLMIAFASNAVMVSY